MHNPQVMLLALACGACGARTSLDSICVSQGDPCAGKCGAVANSCGVPVDCGGCPAGQRCGGGAPNVCGTPACVPSCSANVCGASDGCGRLCETGTCRSGLHCVGGACQCDAISCNGCCANGECLGGTTALACGSGGVCVTCPPGNLCMAGRCTQAPKPAKVVLFGGTGIGLPSDTWTFDGATWALVATTGPAGRYYASMATLP